VLIAWIVIVLLLIVLLLALLFNGLVRRRNRTAEAWSQIAVELKRRHDLVPNLVSTVQGYATHESATFDAVSQARSAAVSAGNVSNPGKVAAAENTLSRTLRSLFAVSEAYPVLRASENFLTLQEQLTATEDKLEYARRYYNTSVRDYDTALQSFPRTLIAGPFGFRKVEFFDADPADQAVPIVAPVRPPKG
jgi:LemA protein